jgi:serine/threonine-protein kinase
MSSPEQDPSGRLGQVLLEKYTLERLVGSGGMATVYAARHRTGRQFAVKMLHPEMSEREDVRERFRREAYAANRVKHEGAVQIIDDDVAEDGSAFLVMELLEGESLTARANRQVVDIGDLLAWVDAILDVLAACHDENIVHRDLKPDNIFLTMDGRVKLLDFGIARVNDVVPSSFKTRVGTAIGTAPYMAPEQALGKMDEIDGRTDLFSVGATMFRLIARRRIHEVKNDVDLLIAMATLPAPPLGSVSSDISTSVCSIVDRALAFLPARRYPDALTMQADVRAVRRGEEPPYASALLAKGLAPWVKRERVQDGSEPTTDERPSERPVEPTVLDAPVPIVASPIQVPAAAPAPVPAASQPLATVAAVEPSRPSSVAARAERPRSAPPSQRILPPRPGPSAPPSRPPSRIVPQPVVMAPDFRAPLAPPLEMPPTPAPSATGFAPVMGGPPMAHARVPLARSAPAPFAPAPIAPPPFTTAPPTADPFVPLPVGSTSFETATPNSAGPPLGFSAPVPAQWVAPTFAPTPTTISGPARSQSSRPAIVALAISGAILVLGLAATVAWWASGTSEFATARRAAVEPSAAAPAPRPITTAAPTTPPAAAAVPSKGLTPTPNSAGAQALAPKTSASPSLAPAAAAAGTKALAPATAQPPAATPSRKSKTTRGKKP